MRRLEGGRERHSREGRQAVQARSPDLHQRPRQKNQAIVKQARQKAGIELEPKSVTGSVFFSSDVANSDTYTHVYCDMEMLMITMASPGTGGSGIRKGL